ncbi:twin-arginine translocase TatA/TatE family subunit [Gryllotalpicola reticulitermitis]|uniref:Sec-independent protein translocase protein TatA n=1 Tax=Gryllotalpicola reticulitermitis TaxID=1184153 RepID=A0ABV8QBM8_9MICO
MGFFRDLGGLHLLIIVLILVLLFGASRLPAVSKGIAQSVRVFRKEVAKKNDEDEGSVARSTESTTTTTTPSDDKK